MSSPLARLSGRDEPTEDEERRERGEKTTTVIFGNGKLGHSGLHEEGKRSLKSTWN